MAIRWAAAKRRTPPLTKRVSKTVRFGVRLQLIPMWVAGGFLLFASTFLLTAGGAYRQRSSLVLDQSAVEFWYGLVVVVVGVVATRSSKAAVLEALLAGMPIALAIARTISDRADFLDRTLIASVAPLCVISLVGFAIRVLAPEPATKSRLSSHP